MTNDPRLAEHLAARDAWDHRVDVLDMLIHYCMVMDAPYRFGCTDERDDWIGDEIDRYRIDQNLDDRDHEYIRGKLLELTSSRILR